MYSTVCPLWGWQQAESEGCVGRFANLGVGKQATSEGCIVRFAHSELEKCKHLMLARLSGRLLFCDPYGVFGFSRDGLSGVWGSYRLSRGALRVASLARFCLAFLVFFVAFHEICRHVQEMSENLEKIQNILKTISEAKIRLFLRVLMLKVPNPSRPHFSRGITFPSC